MIKVAVTILILCIARKTFKLIHIGVLQYSHLNLLKVLIRVKELAQE